MEMQIIQFNRMVHDEQYKQAERYHQGMKHGAYDALLRRIQRFVLRRHAALTAGISKRPHAQEHIQGPCDHCQI